MKLTEAQRRDKLKSLIDSARNIDPLEIPQDMLDEASTLVNLRRDLLGMINRDVIIDAIKIVIGNSTLVGFDGGKAAHPTVDKTVFTISLSIGEEAYAKYPTGKDSKSRDEVFEAELSKKSTFSNESPNSNRAVDWVIRMIHGEFISPFKLEVTKRVQALISSTDEAETRKFFRTNKVPTREEIENSLLGSIFKLTVSHTGKSAEVRFIG
jgi:hypothetical protein